MDEQGYGVTSQHVLYYIASILDWSDFSIDLETETLMKKIGCRLKLHKERTGEICTLSEHFR